MSMARVQIGADELVASSVELASGANLHPASPNVVAAPDIVDRRPVADAAKRCFDVAITLGLLAPAALLFPVLALAILAESRGPVLFRQRRLGRGGEEFTILKFRSMHTDAEAVLAADDALYAAFRANGCKLPDGQDPRVTRVGRLLRATSLDELPQLWNVLRGDMSLVGPRPPIVEQIPELYGPDTPFYFAVRPGLTGLWQVSGRSDLTEAQRRELDVRYVKERSFLGDLRLLLATLPAVIRQRGAH